jgi:hypothetical protein
MMHPDDIKLLIKICECIVIVAIIIFSFRFGQDFYKILMSGDSL